ncbi:unnamed protein product [Rotaria socialis]|uniref:ubiquitinyl hydrolase 1 n=1 Tax=Rotaria socialis TaxID=392032 RepID=A0A818EYA3_9BILA|nr:unnamed protein product [Rotaria socialis]CAF4638932.1 unnamed protein product [Rotaria socialis]CAF4821966.1 unnamed protein product [Rotaria socialis]
MAKHSNNASTKSMQEICGLRNLGNTCFMNGILQCLNSTFPLIDAVRQSSFLRNSGRLSKSFANLVEDLKNPKSSPVDPSSFKAAVGKYTTKFLGYEQQDSHELLTVVLEALIEETINANDRSIISDLFEGQMQYTIKCLQPGCSYEKVDTDPFYTLSLFIEDKTENRSSTKRDSRVLHVRYINLEGHVQIRDISFSSNDTIKLLDDKLQPSPNCCYNNAVLRFADRISTHSGFIHPPTVIRVPKNCNDRRSIAKTIEKHLKNLLDLGNYTKDISGDIKVTSESHICIFESNITVWCDKEDFKHSKLLKKSLIQETTYVTASSWYPEMSSSSTTLEQCLSNIAVREYLSPSSVWCCSQCGRTSNASKQNRLVSTPPVLVIQLKRFHFNYSTTTKVERLVKYPLELDMNPFLLLPRREKRPVTMYDLVGVCLHSGTRANGHTTAYVKRSISGQWYYCDDSYTCPISKNEVIERNTRDAYILFYVRRSST